MMVVMVLLLLLVLHLVTLVVVVLVVIQLVWTLVTSGVLRPTVIALHRTPVYGAAAQVQHRGRRALYLVRGRRLLRLLLLLLVVQRQQVHDIVVGSCGLIAIGGSRCAHRRAAGRKVRQTGLRLLLRRGGRGRVVRLPRVADQIVAIGRIGGRGRLLVLLVLLVLVLEVHGHGFRLQAATATILVVGAADATIRKT